MRCSVALLLPFIEAVTAQADNPLSFVSASTLWSGGSSPIVNTTYASFQGKEDDRTKTSNYIGKKNCLELHAMIDSTPNEMRHRHQICHCTSIRPCRALQHDARRSPRCERVWSVVPTAYGDPFRPGTRYWARRRGGQLTAGITSHTGCSAAIGRLPIHQHCATSGSDSARPPSCPLDVGRDPRGASFLLACIPLTFCLFQSWRWLRNGIGCFIARRSRRAGGILSRQSTCAGEY